MSHSPITSLLRKLAEGAIPPAEVDLWPGIRSLYETRKAHPKGDFSMKLSFAHNRRLVLAAIPILAVVLTAAVLLITPQGRAWAQSTLQFFTRAESNTIPAPTSEPLVWVEQTPGAPAPTMTPLPPMAPYAAECGDYRIPRCSIEQIRGKVDFTVQELVSLPAGMYFVGATGGPQEVYITYDSGDRSRFISLIELPWTGSSQQKGFEVAPGVAVENVSIGGATGEYVKGSFGYMAGETVATWKPDTGQETLKWSDQNIYYTLVYISNSTPLGIDGLAALAESLTTGPVSANLPPAPATATPDVFDFSPEYPLTIVEAKAQAGFSVLAPTSLPEILSFLGARYDVEHNVVTIFYLFEQVLWGPNTDGLLLSEQLAPNGADCDLCGFVAGDLSAAQTAYAHKVIGLDATVETVQIGDVNGQYVEGIWGAEDNSGMKWLSDPYVKSLRWQKDGMAYELVYYGMALEKADLIAIAESIR